MFKNRNFKKNRNLRQALGPICIIVPNVIEIGQMVAEILRFNCFQNGGRPRSRIIEIQKFSR